jgi:hypothetical protein
MIMKVNFTITDQIIAVGKETNLTPYGISRAIAAEAGPTNRERMACEKRWQMWLQGRNLKRLEILEADLNGLGYRLKVEKL